MGLATKLPNLDMTASAEKTVEAIDFAGTTTSFVKYTNNFFRDTDLRGASSGKALTLSFWFKLDSVVNPVGINLIDVTSTTTNQHYRVHLTIDESTDPDDIRLVFLYEEDNSNLITVSTQNGVVNLNTWYHVLISVKVDTVGKIAINDTIVATNATFGGDIGNVPGASEDTFLGTQASYNASEPPNLDGQLAEIWLKDRFYDITNSGTRKLFISENSKPVNLPGAPLVYLNGNHTTWTNSGSSDLGTQTLSNITTASSSPSD